MTGRITGSGRRYPPGWYYDRVNGHTLQAYSRLSIVLAEQNLTVYQLHRRLATAGFPINIKSLYRLASDQPLYKVDLRIAAAICKVCDVGLGQLISFEKPRALLRRLDSPTQARLEALMAKNNEGHLTPKEKKEFARLAEEAHRLSLENARLLQAERRRSQPSRAQVAKAGETVSA
jgi:hypothetical protein